LELGDALAADADELVFDELVFDELVFDEFVCSSDAVGVVVGVSVEIVWQQSRDEQAGSLGSCACVASIQLALNRTAQLSNRKRLAHHRPHRFDRVDRLRGRGGIAICGSK
jgi:hypothetical protein